MPVYTATTSAVRIIGPDWRRWAEHREESMRLRAEPTSVKLERIDARLAGERSLEWSRRRRRRRA